MDINLKISQKLTVSHQLILSTEILRMSSGELSEFLSEISLDNPLVEYTPPALDDTIHNLSNRLEWMESYGGQSVPYYEADTYEHYINPSGAVPSDETLEDHLLIQIRTQKLAPNVALAAEFAVKSLDKNGYLTENAESISNLSGVSINDAEEAINIIQRLDPAGAGAFNLQQCLILQLERETVPDKSAINIVKYHLDDMAKNRIKTISSSLGISVADVSESIKKIRSLNPKPSRGFASKDVLSYIIPDAIIQKDSDGGYSVELNDNYSPSLKISGYYKKIIKSSGDNQAISYINKKLRQAQWIISCIEKRSSTLLSTIYIIVEKQKCFFDKGPGNLIPMRLSDISSELSMHESTVSRAVRDKYIQCVWGIFPLGYFFSSSVTTSSGEDISQSSVKGRIMEIIEAEDKKHPLSDRAIAEALENNGISISRRTVTKYRELLGIGSASIRKDF